jgi:hypothetical protein
MNFVTGLEECVKNFKIDKTQKFNNVRNQATQISPKLTEILRLLFMCIISGNILKFLELNLI